MEANLLNFVEYFLIDSFLLKELKQEKLFLESKGNNYFYSL